MKIIKRPIARNGWCRGCFKTLVKGEEVVVMKSSQVYLCIDCAKEVGKLADKDSP